jgi:hypothetical protein
MPEILVTGEAEIGRITVQATVSKNPISTNSWVWWHTCHSCYRGDVNGRIMIQIIPEKKHKTLPEK